MNFLANVLTRRHPHGLVLRGLGLAIALLVIPVLPLSAQVTQESLDDLDDVNVEESLDGEGVPATFPEVPSPEAIESLELEESLELDTKSPEDESSEDESSEESSESESVDEDGVPVNPLELTEPDPLLPTGVVDRPLSPQEQVVLDTALDELNQQAEAQLQAGDIAGAIEIWNRELRLRRFLGPEQEVESLTRVGEVAWRENQVTEVRLITQRLQEIELETAAQSPPNYDLQLKIAQAYQTLRARDPAVALYNKLLLRAQEQQDVTQQRQILTNLGAMHVAWFDYANAATTYEALLVLAQSQGDETTELEALKQLSRIYQDSDQPEQAIAVQQRLVDIYQSKQQFEQITELKQQIGDEYVALGRPDLAATSYQEAFAIARSAQQYAYAGDALQRLANLYISLERLEDALVVYQLLLDVRQQSYDTLGMMNTYDQMGQIHRALGNTTQAIAAFERGLQLAQQLSYKVGYFTAQIQELGGQ